jgi:hypothetical protein
MGEARHPGPYKEGTRKQMTRKWKLSVLAKLEENENADVKPGSVPDLARLIKPSKPGYKAGLYRALNPDGDQVSSADVDIICEILKIAPPLVESDDDEDLRRDIDLLRTLTPEARRVLMANARLLPKRSK